MNATPTTALLDEASLSILRAQHYAQMIRELHEEMPEALQDRFYALNQALEDALSDAKGDVDQANSQIVVEPRLAFPDEASTPPTPPRSKSTAAKSTDSQEATA